MNWGRGKTRFTPSPIQKALSPIQQHRNILYKYVENQLVFTKFSRYTGSNVYHKRR